MVMEKFHEILKNHHEYARDWKKKTGRKVLGYYEPYMPEEIAFAAGFLPVRLLSEHEPDDITDLYMYGQCACTRDLLNLFANNDKCATGMGLGIELMANLLHVHVREIGEKSLAVKDDPQLAGSIGAALIAI